MVSATTWSLILDWVNSAAFLLVVTYVAYVVLITVPLLRRRPAARGDSSAFEWHFLIPCLNEEAVVGETVRRLVAQFPAAGVWCIDDGSDDGTPVVLAGLAHELNHVHVVTRRFPEARTGKGPALNAGWQAILDRQPASVAPERVVVAVVDADGHLDPDCLDLIAGPSFLGDPTVGAVQIKVRVVDRTAPDGPQLSRSRRLLVRLQDVEFTGVIAAQQTLRRHLGSVGMGGNGQFTRLSALNQVADGFGTPWHGSLLEDFELGLHVLLIGQRSQYCDDTWVEQEGLSSFWGLVRQRSRWAQGNMQCWRYLSPVLRSRHIATPGALEIAYFLVLPWIQVVGSVLYLIVLALFAYYAFFATGGPLAWLGGGAWGIIPLLLIFGIGPLAVWGPIYRAHTAPDMGRARSLALGLSNWPYAIVHYLATWWAFSRVVRSRHDWKKTERAAPQPVLLPPIVTSALPAVHVTLSPSRLVAGTFARTHPRHIEYRRASAVGRFRPRTSTTASSQTERTKIHV